MKRCISNPVLEVIWPGDEKVNKFIESLGE